MNTNVGFSYPAFVFPCHEFVLTTWLASSQRTQSFVKQNFFDLEVQKLLLGELYFELQY